MKLTTTFLYQVDVRLIGFQAAKQSGNYRLVYVAGGSNFRQALLELEISYFITNFRTIRIAPFVKRTGKKYLMYCTVPIKVRPRTLSRGLKAQ